jgi:AraC-like DNA-binding protein
MESFRTIEDCHRTPRAVAALASDYPHGYYMAPHRHLRAQLIHALTGVMTVMSEHGSLVVPAGRAVWMPAGSDHAVRFFGGVSMRTIYVAPVATRVPLNYELGGRDHRVMELILDELERAPRLQLHVPMPRDPRLMRLCEKLVASPSDPATLADLAAGINVSERTLARLFHRELGMSFGQWLRRMRLLLSLPRLAAGVSVLQVALEHGYDSPSAYSAMFRRTLGIAPTAYLDAQ